MPLLEIRNLTKNFGGLAALTDLDLDVHANEIIGLIGPNGAGKTTTFNVITGDYAPSGGRILFQGQDIAGLKVHRISRLGISRSFQLNKLFSHLSVRENILLGLHLRSTLGFWEGLLNTSSNRRKQQQLNAQADSLMAFMGLEEHAEEEALNLAHGHQRTLGIAIALASRPKLLLLDEPLTGMNPQEVESMLVTIRGIRERFGLTLIVVEHNMKAVMSLCERIAVINFGVKIAEGTPREIQSHPDVIQAYLGKEDDAA